MTASVEFVRGHCGFDAVTLIADGQVPAEDELACAVKILAAPVNGGLEVGWMGRGGHPDEIRLRMVNSTTRNWIPMCGGMTQVIGKALVETFMRERFEVDISKARVTRRLITPAGVIPIHMDISNGRAARVTTVMDDYLNYVYERGIEPLMLNSVPVWRVGTYVVIDVTALEERHPSVDFTRRDSGPHLDIVNDLLKAFRAHMGLSGVNGMLYDDRPEGPGQYRVFPRFYSDDLSAARIPWEFQCGTGSIAVAMTLAHRGRLACTAGRGSALLEWGSYRTTRDPYGIRTSEVVFEVDDRRVKRASFSHSVIEILAEGKLRLPAY